MRGSRVKRLVGTPYVIGVDDQDVMGRGAFGRVHRAVNVERRWQRVAVKVVQNWNRDLQSLKELEVIGQLPEHPNIVRYLKVRICSQQNLYIVMEECEGGNLQTAMQKAGGPLPARDLLSFLHQFARGYTVLLDKGILHRDIKPQNVLIGGGSFKIADFGLAKFGIQNVSSKGTPVFMAPELFEEGSQRTSKLDVYSLGVLLTILASGSSLNFGGFSFFASDYRELLKNKMAYKPPKCNVPLIDRLLPRMLEPNPLRRISWQQLFAELGKQKGPALGLEQSLLLRQSLRDNPSVRWVSQGQKSLCSAHDISARRPEDQLFRMRQAVLFLDTTALMVMMKGGRLLKDQSQVVLSADCILELALKQADLVKALLQSSKEISQKDKLLQIVEKDLQYLAEFRAQLGNEHPAKKTQRAIYQKLKALIEALKLQEEAEETAKSAAQVIVYVEQVMAFIEKNCAKCLLLREDAETLVLRLRQITSKASSPAQLRTQVAQLIGRFY